MLVSLRDWRSPGADGLAERRVVGIAQGEGEDTMAVARKVVARALPTRPAAGGFQGTPGDRGNATSLKGLFREQKRTVLLLK